MSEVSRIRFLLDTSFEYRQGNQAYQNGLKFEDNPYDEDSFQHESWALGFDDAELWETL